MNLATLRKTVVKGAGLKFIGLKLDLQKLLNCRVDLVSDKSLNRYISDKILQEAIEL